MEKVKVEICVGTYSYVMGGADLMNMEKDLPAELSDKVIFAGAIQFPGVNEKTMRPPFARVNGKLISSANEEKIMKAIKKEIEVETV